MATLIHHGNCDSSHDYTPCNHGNLYSSHNYSYWTAVDMPHASQTLTFGQSFPSMKQTDIMISYEVKYIPYLMMPVDQSCCRCLMDMGSGSCTLYWLDSSSPSDNWPGWWFLLHFQARLDHSRTVRDKGGKWPAHPSSYRNLKWFRITKS